MALLKIVKYPASVLNEVCEPVGDDPGRMKKLYTDMSETMFANDGAGLAAPQVGETHRMFIIDPDVAGLDAEDSPLVFIDPEIIELSDDLETSDEGCLSFPGVFVPIERSFRCTTRATNLEGETFEVSGEGLFARAMQHENDHLNGKLLTNYVGRLKRKQIARRMAKESAQDND